MKNRSLRIINNLKIHILFDFKKGPYGGGNQFLKNLKYEFLKKNKYCEKATEANVILFNSFHEMAKAVFLKYCFPEKIFIHRIDGPISLYRGKDFDSDKIIYFLSEQIADGVVYQSFWSKNNNLRLNALPSVKSQVILNAADPKVFRPSLKKKKIKNQKIKIIATSWSSNLNKGFAYYSYLDEHLNFSKFEMTFIGNSPVKFINIRIKDPVESRNLSQELRKADLYLTASKNDACPNSLIEALSCGLPAVAMKSGGQPEIVGIGGELFVSKKQMLKKINLVAKNIKKYQKQINVPSLKTSTEEYYQFAENLSETKNNHQKKIGLVTFIYLEIKILLFKINNVSRNLIKKIRIYR
jgi:glycosyltransferase involved in cell wall biosynthesis